ncbi:DUF4238 domain-containing protein [Microbacterium maritypicum]|uniref:DUF4238 domain-containing protein n=1 Tax=Microbacterium maritypicum TaxID=33918 RepID=UPI0037F24A9B
MTQQTSNAGRKPATRHHVVPRFYLDGFARQRQIGVVPLPGDVRFLQNVSDATVQNNFYTVAGHPDGPDVFERAMGRVEAEAATVLRKVVDEGVWPLPGDDRETLATLITLQILREPTQRQQMRNTALAVARLLVDTARPEWLQTLAAEKGEQLSTDDAARQLEELQTAGPIDVTVSAASHAGQIGYLLPRLIRYVMGRPWALVRFARRGLITSDSPVSLVPDPSMPAHLRMGLMTARGFTFPLSRRTALMMSSPEPFIAAGRHIDEVASGAFDLARPGSTRDERAINLATALGARKRIYHHPDDDAFIPEVLPDPVDDTLSADDIYNDFDEAWLTDDSSAE